MLARNLIMGLFALAILAGCGPTPHPAEPDLSELYQKAPRGPLPSGVGPTGYEIDLVIDPRRQRFGGSVTMDVAFDQPATGFWLHGQGLEIKAVTITDGASGPASGYWRDVLRSGVAWVGFPRRAGPGFVTVRIDYSAPFDANLAGLFRVQEQGDSYALAKSESIQARRFMPGFDEPRFKAPFSISLTVPEGYEAISNSVEISREPTQTGMQRIRFKRTRPLPTYLLSLAVGPFDRVDAPSLAPNAVRSVAVPVKGYTRRDKGDEIAYALSTTAAMVEFFETALEIPYPYDKLDIIAAPQWPSGATELAGAITYRESRILFGPSSGPAARRALLNIHSHEIAHMWFGDLVTPPWWDDLWLKEGFASWATGIVLSELEPDGGFELDAISESISAMSLDSLQSARAVREPITLNDDIRNAYDSITYDKGLAVIAMVDGYFGAETFRPALGRYIARFEDGVADSADFFRVIGQETNEPDLTKAFRSFVEQSGLPRIDARLQCSENQPPRVRIQQSRYTPLGSPIEQDRRWTIPFCLIAGAEGEKVRQCEMLDSEAAVIAFDELESCPDWIMPNADGKGYWRFNLDSPQWATLAVHFAELSGGEALVAVDSAIAAFEAGDASLASVMAVVNAGARRPERQVVSEAVSAYAKLLQFVPKDSEARIGYETEIQRLFKPQIEMLAGGDDENNRILVSKLESFVARYGNDTALRSEFSNAARAYIGLRPEASVRELTSDDFSTALAIAMQDGGRPVYDALLSAVDRIDDPMFEQAAAYAIGQNTDADLNPEILALAISGEVGTREAYTLVSGQMGRDETRAQTWDWLRRNYPAFVKVIPGQRPRSTPRMASGLCRPEAIGELQRLFERYGELAPGHERALAEAKEKIQLCVALRAEKSDEVQRYFSLLVPVEAEPVENQAAEETTPDEIN
ncbi:M1 family metallopeptidase [Henriciella pelagia]|uniref:Aminopeptidase n=1 Tax=Henriciella pelagia TaxID=1977912 RepID=A0ABQ1J411_9PROT|nr:M1 family metallopeptidase [Henriciella pelagia]GGB58288.1 aminopeptidase N [Henriciella pelagia]